MAHKDTANGDDDHHSDFNVSGTNDDKDSDDNKGGWKPVYTLPFLAFYNHSKSHFSRTLKVIQCQMECDRHICSKVIWNLNELIYPRLYEGNKMNM